MAKLRIEAEEEEEEEEEADVVLLPLRQSIAHPRFRHEQRTL
jgi:hypothetical protein